MHKLMHHIDRFLPAGEYDVSNQTQARNFAFAIKTNHVGSYELELTRIK